MIRRVEFSLDLDNPSEAALYNALYDLLRHRRAGEVIRHALTCYLFQEPERVPTVSNPVSRNMTATLRVQATSTATDEHTTHRIVSQSAEMFGF